VEGYGVAFFYWGTSNQTLATDVAGTPLVGGSSGVEDVLGPQGHPPYRRQAVLVLKGFLFGREKVSAPSIEVILGRKPVQSIITGSAANLDEDGHANPLALLAEALTDPVFGLGMDTSRLDSATWQACADELYIRRAETYISPAIERPQSARSLIDELREYYDGWFRWTNPGKIAAGRFLRGESPPEFDSTNTITADDLIEEPSLDSKGWAETYNEVAVKFQDAANQYKDSGVTVKSPYNRNVVGEPRQVTMNRLHVTRIDQATRLAAELLRVVGEPNLSGKLVLRGTRAEGLPVGTVFKFVHDLLGINIIARVIGRSTDAPPSERVTIEFEADKALAVVSTVPGAATEPSTDLAAPESLGVYQFFQPPRALFDESIPRLCVLSTRTNPLTVGMNLHLKRADSSIFQRIDTQTGFCVRGLLNASYSSSLGLPDDNSETLSLTLDATTLAIDFDIIGETQSEDMIEDGNLLAFIFSAANPANFEILTVRAGRLSSGNYLLKVRRGQYGTTARSFVSGDACWIMHRTKLTEFAHASFPSFADSSVTATFRLQSFTTYAEADISDTDVCPDISFTFAPVDRTTVSQDDYVEPDGVTGVEVEPGFNAALVSWQLPTNVIVARTLIYEASTAVMPGSPTLSVAAPTAIQWFTGIVAPATRYYWLQVQSESGRVSSIAGPYSVTITGVNVADFAPGLRPVEIVDALPSTGNFLGRLVVLTTDTKVYRWTNDVIGTGTLYWSKAVDGADVVAGSIIAGAIAAGAITADKVGANEIITSAANIGDAVITGAKIANATIGTGNIQNLAVTTAKIADANITTVKIADANITTAKIADANITTAKIADANITTAKIADANITTAKIEDANITNAKIANLAVDTVKIANQAVTIPVSSYTAGNVSIATSTYTTIQTASITSTGAPIHISASATMKMGTGAATMDFRLQRGGTTIYEATTMDYDFAAMMSFQVQDTPGAGSVTYTVQARVTAGSRNAANRSLLLLETKK